jgi:hypothetical protein
MTDSEPLNILDLAEAVAANRLAINEAEGRIRARHGESRRAEADLAELRSLARALGAVDAHVRATRESAGASPAAAPIARFGETPAVAVGGAVRRRTASRPEGRSPQRPVLVFALVLLLGAGLAAASFVGGRLASQVPQPSSFAPVAVASPSGSVPQASSAASERPAPASEQPSSKPQPRTVRAALWTVSDPGHISVSQWTLKPDKAPAPFTIDTWPDPDKASGAVIYRQVLASPTGRYFAIAETDPRARTRLRLTSNRGQMIWSDESANGIPSLAWSGDGSQLAIAFAPEPWLVVKAAGQSASARNYPLPAGSALKLVGFSADGQSLLGYEGTGEAAPWEQPMSVDLASGEISRLQAFPPIAASNSTTVSPRVDPLSGRVLDPGGLAGTDPNWGMYSGQRRVELELPVTTRRTLIDPRWTDTGTILVLQTPIDDKPPSNNQQDPVLQLLREPGPGAKPERIADASWPFRGSTGTRCRGALLEARAGRVLIGLATYPSDDEPWMGYDDINLFDLETGALLSLGFEGIGAFDIHSAGLVD